MKTSLPETSFVLRTKHAHLAAVLHRAPGKRLVILCHGFTGDKVEHSRLFVQTARALQKAGLNALRFDFMGSGDSSGEFQQTTPGTQIQDALDVLAWAQRRYTRIAFLGLSFGGATTICATHAAKRRPDALLTWSSVPDLNWWRESMGGADRRDLVNPMVTGKAFWSYRPKTDVPEAYAALDLPRLQIQGDNDIPGFRERFVAFCPKDDPQVSHIVIPGADHVFSTVAHRKRVVTESVRWLKKQLA